MKFKLFLLIAIVLAFANCKNESQENNSIEGRWKLFKIVALGNHITYPNSEDQIQWEFKSNQDYIIYDFKGFETERSKYQLTENSIILYVEGIQSEYLYWINVDTLRIRNIEGFIVYDNYFARQ